jgi:hypothetical protein
MNCRGIFGTQVTLPRNVNALSSNNTSSVGYQYSQLLAFWPGSSCTASCAQLEFCKFCCPLCWVLTLQYEDSIGAKIFLHLLLIEHQCHATSFQSKHYVSVSYFHSGMRLSLTSFPYIILPQSQSPGTDVFMQIQFYAYINFTKFLSSCDDCQALKRKFYLNQFICSNPVHTLPFSLLSIHSEWTATITCKLLETLYGDDALSYTKFHWMETKCSLKCKKVVFAKVSDQNSK